MVLVALGLLLLQGPRLLHLLLVSHATCEHGELIEIHGDRDGAARRSEPRATAERGDAKRVAVQAGHGGAAGHDHCDMLALRHLPPGVGQALVAPSLLAFLPSDALGQQDEERPVPLLSLAPKSSPPVA